MKFHISDSGKIVECKAQPGKCPKQNFDNFNDAEQFLKESQDNTLSGLSKTRRNPLRTAEEYYGGQFLTPYEIPLTKSVETVLEDMRKIGNPLIVGGAVRDSFIGADNKDIDIEVHKTDIDTLVKTLKNKGYSVDEVGKQFGVLKVSKKGVVRDLDISVPRKENRLGAGHRSFEVDLDKNMTVSEAAERRDFTFNAVMYDHKRKVLVDPSGGKKDFENRIMRHVSEKFAEDPLRVLRGFQFAGRFDMTMAPETIALSKKLRPEYEHLSVERVQEEWGKFFTKSTNLNKGIQVLQETGWDDTEPELREALNNDQVKEALDKLPKSPKNRRIIYGAAAIISAMSKESVQKNFLNKSVIGVKEQREAYILATLDKENIETTYQRKKIAKELEKFGFTFKDYGQFSEMMNDRKAVEISKLAEKEGIAEKAEPDLIMGKDILEVFDKKPGKWMGELLMKSRDEQYRGKIKTKQEALDFAKNYLKNLG